MPEELLHEANRGRDVLGPDGFFVIPAGIERIWIDVGAHHLETTRSWFDANPDLALVAVEPLSQCWGTWPEDPRLIGLPVAVDLDRGWQDFHVNALDDTSSLGRSARPDLEDTTRTIEIRKVPVVRLDDILRAIPPDLEIEFLETDVQGYDLRVLQSAGAELRRVRWVKAEVVVERLYEGPGGEDLALETEYSSYMENLGFRFVTDIDVAERRRWLDKVYLNRRADAVGPRGPLR